MLEGLHKSSWLVGFRLEGSPSWSSHRVWKRLSSLRVVVLHACPNAPLGYQRFAARAQRSPSNGVQRQMACFAVAKRQRQGDND